MEKIKLYLLQAALPFAETLMRAFGDLFQRQVLSSAGLAGQAAVTTSIANTFFAIVNGTSVRVASGNGPSLTGYNLTNVQVGGVVYVIDNTGTVSFLPIQPAAALGQVVYPVIPPNQVAIGAALINTSSAATFTGGTTNSNAANVTHVSFTGPFNPLNAF